MQVTLIGWFIGLALGSTLIASIYVILGKYKYRLYQRYINLYQITDEAEKNEELKKYGFTINCNCKPTLKDCFNASESNNAIVILHWLRLVPVHGKKIGPINFKTVHDKKASFNDVYKSVHNRNKKNKDIREPYTNA